MNLNKAMVIGNLTRDPEVKTTPQGQQVASFSVATNMVWKDQNGQKQERAEYHNVVAWRKLAEIIGQYLKKGSKVYIEGRMQTRDWEGQDGVKRYRTEIVADNMIMLDSKGGNSGGGSSYASNDTSGSQPSQGSDLPTIETEIPNTAPSASDEINIDEIPF